MVTFAPKTLITSYLEMTNPNQFEASFIHAHDIRIERMKTVDLHFYLYLYSSVGEKLAWRDRILMPKDELHAALSNPNTAIYVLYVGGAAAGYVELYKDGTNVEIAYFGLREEYHGRGLGKHLLSYGIQKAWDAGAKRVWVHTCNLDGQHALANYEKRGFRVYQTEEEAMPEKYQ
jgi:ribosomal protein S18 acetylase RimI-like enzyme